MKPHAERHINESRLSVKYRIPPMSAGRILFQQFIHGFLIPYLGNEKIEQTGIADSEQRPCGTAPFVRILIRPVHPHQHIPDKAELLQRNRLRNHFRFR